ncbi:MAG: hypothetical protein ACTSXV_01425 [Alphaproteobacteria bacterium]
MVSNPCFLTDDMQLASVVKSFKGDVSLENVVAILAKTNPVLKIKVFLLLKERVGEEKANKLFRQAEDILKKVQ